MGIKCINTCQGLSWHHQINGREFEHILGDSEAQGSLACCSLWDCKDSDTTERLNNRKCLAQHLSAQEDFLTQKLQLLEPPGLWAGSSLLWLVLQSRRHLAYVLGACRKRESSGSALSPAGDTPGLPGGGGELLGVPRDSLLSPKWLWWVAGPVLWTTLWVSRLWSSVKSQM